MGRPLMTERAANIPNQTRPASESIDEQAPDDTAPDGQTPSTDTAETTLIPVIEDEAPRRWADTRLLAENPYAPSLPSLAKVRPSSPAAPTTPPQGGVFTYPNDATAQLPHHSEPLHRTSESALARKRPDHSQSLAMSNEEVQQLYRSRDHNAVGKALDSVIGTNEVHSLRERARKTRMNAQLIGTGSSRNHDMSTNISMAGDTESNSMAVAEDVDSRISADSTAHGFTRSMLVKNTRFTSDSSATRQVKSVLRTTVPKVVKKARSETGEKAPAGGHEATSTVALITNDRKLVYSGLPIFRYNSEIPTSEAFKRLVSPTGTDSKNFKPGTEPLDPGLNILVMGSEGITKGFGDTSHAIQVALETLNRRGIFGPPPEGTAIQDETADLNLVANIEAALEKHTEEFGKFETSKNWDYGATVVARYLQTVLGAYGVTGALNVGLVKVYESERKGRGRTATQKVAGGAAMAAATGTAVAKRTEQKPSVVQELPAAIAVEPKATAARGIRRALGAARTKQVEAHSRFGKYVAAGTIALGVYQFVAGAMELTGRGSLPDSATLAGMLHHLKGGGGNSALHHLTPGATPDAGPPTGHPAGGPDAGPVTPPPVETHAKPPSTIYHALSHDPLNDGKATTVTGISIREIDTYGHRMGYSPHQIELLKKDQTLINQVNHAFMRENPDVQHDPRNYVYAGVDYHTQKTGTFTQEAITARARQLHMHPSTTTPAPAQTTTPPPATSAPKSTPGTTEQTTTVTGSGDSHITKGLGDMAAGAVIVTGTAWVSSRGKHKNASGGGGQKAPTAAKHRQPATAGRASRRR